MRDFIIQMGLSNACFSVVLAILAMVVGTKSRRPHLAYMLWLLVFIKLVTPPILRIPVVSIPQVHDNTILIGNQSQNEQTSVIDTKSDGTWLARIRLELWKYAVTWFLLMWLAGSISVFTWTLLRVFKFNRLLLFESEAASEELQSATAKIASRLKLKTIPAIYTTSAHISPMVWWIGRKVKIVIPFELLRQMEHQQWYWILAHELAHVRRRDYLVRWLEWIACVCFWWNPVVLIAQRNLRAMEEICCDELVMSSLNPEPKYYANSLLSAVEFLAQPALRPPAIASEINSGGFLERRFKMIITNKLNSSNSRRLQLCVLLCAIVVLPLGIASAQNYDAVGKRLRQAVAAGELSGEQARAMLETLRNSGASTRENAANINTQAARVRVRQQATAKATAEQSQSITNRPANQISEETRAELRKAVAEGKLSKEEALAKLAELRKKQAQQSAVSSERTNQQNIVNVRAQLKKEVTEGMLTKEEALAKLAELRKKQVQQNAVSSQRTTRQNIANVRAQLQKEVTEGKISKEEALTKLAELRKKQAQQSVVSSERTTRQNIANVRAQLQKEVTEGKLTKEQARAKLDELHKQMAQE